MLGQAVDSKRQVRKLLRALPDNWKHVCYAIQVAKDLKKISLEELLGTLSSYEIEMT